MALIEEQPIRLPKISDGTGTHGVSGYAGKVEVYDPAKEKARIQKLSAEAVAATPMAIGVAPVATPTTPEEKTTRADKK